MPTPSHQEAETKSLHSNRIVNSRC